jgi:hypothetical protein
MDLCPHFSTYIVCIKLQMRTQIHVLSSLYISFVSKYKWGHRSTSCLLSIYRLYQSTSEDTDPHLVFSLYIVCIKVQVRTQIHVLSSLYISFVSKYKWGHRSTSYLPSIYCLYQSTSEDTDPRLVFSLYIVCIKVQVRTQIHILSSLVLWYKRYIERRQDVDLCPHLYFYNL